jgi:regulator of replication initiation timing
MQQYEGENRKHDEAYFREQFDKTTLDMVVAENIRLERENARLRKALALCMETSTSPRQDEETEPTEAIEDAG